MRIFAQTSQPAEISRLAKLGLLDGLAVPALDHDNSAYQNLVAQIAAQATAPVCASINGADYDSMMEEAAQLIRIARNIAITVPAIEAGFAVCKTLAGSGTLTAVGLCYTAGQALLAAKAGATFVMPCFSGTENSGESGHRFIADVCDVFRNYPAIKTEILVASLANAGQVIECAKIGAHGVLLKPHVVSRLSHHETTLRQSAKATPIFA